MKIIMYIGIALFTFHFLAAAGQTKKKNNDLANRTYTVNLKSTKSSGKGTGWQWTTDEISFPGGMLRSKMMREHERFEDAVCAIDETANDSTRTMKFTAEKKNDSGSKVVWKGKVKGNHIEGTVDWTNKQGKQSYSFAGTLKGA